MKRLLLLSFVSFVAFAPQLHSISLTEYIEQNGMPQIKASTLDLSYKNITDITGLQDIPDIEQVTSLYLSGNQLKTLPTDIFNGLTNLQELHLNSNKLKILPATIFSGLTNLQWLSLSRNRLQQLSENVFSDLRNLLQLYLDGNRLETLPATVFNNLHNLYYLSLNNNRLQNLPGTISLSTLRNLNKLYISSNQLQTLPSTIFNGLHNLQHLDLRDNAFTLDFIPTLTDMIRNIPNLVYLNCKSKDKTLQKVPFTTLKQLAIEYVANDINTYRDKLQKLPQELKDEVVLVSNLSEPTHRVIEIEDLEKIFLK